MVDLLPPFWRGFLIAAFFAAYMSTISTQLNWGASYLVNDVYRRFWARGRSERHYAAAGRLATLVMMVISGVVTLNIGTVEGAWKFLLAIRAGTGLVYLALFGIGGLVLGRRGSGALAVVAAVLLTWYLVTATRPAARTETSMV